MLADERGLCCGPEGAGMITEEVRLSTHASSASSGPSEPEPNFIGGALVNHDPDRKLDLSAHKRREHHSIQNLKCAD